MMKLDFRKSLLGIPACLFSIMDTVITLAGQPDAYWSDHARYMEDNPLFAKILMLGPEWFIAGEILWDLLIIAAVILLPGFLSLVAAISFVIGHAFGFLSWLIFCYKININWIYLYFPVVALVIGLQAKFYYQRLVARNS